MSRSSANRHSSRRRGRERDRYYRVEPDYDTDVSRSSRRDYDRDRRHDRDLYDYSTYDDRYSTWRDLYRDDYYRGNWYSDYGYRRGYDDYYDYPSYDYDSYYVGESSRNCKACSRGRRMGPDPYVYRYEEERSPRKRRGHESRRSRRVTTEEVIEPEKAEAGKAVDVYAMQEVKGKDGFKGQKEHKYSDPRTKQKDRRQLKPVNSAISSDSDELDTRGKERRARRTGRKRSVNEYDDWD